ncbi:MAG: MBOAT family protein [Chitinophagales bacterium]|jgi:alginate O-acetyltransferase complex protein AlgI|nr:MBOAT family protein [Chitinophagales bacterium]
MVFASLIFLCLFLPLNILLYYSYNNATYRNYVLILFSLFFYAWGEPIWVLLLIFSALVDYLNALFIEHYRGTKYAKWGVVSSLIVNLGVLISFKYSGFLYENLNYYLGLSLTVPKIALPIGISFYTFQTISYTIDVYRGEVKAQTSFPKFLMFVSLYHQLVAGPIVRYVHIMNDIEQRKEKLEEIFWGLHRFLIGLFKKVAIANVAAVWVAQYLDGNFSELSVAEAWFGILMFSIQIYFDFSGYSDMAIGLGKMFGFHYLENFNYPYISRSATEFWRRWHISLGTFFRDYVYIPLGGNKQYPYRNLLIVWALTGLWHGASWNFIFWGIYFGVLILIEKLFLMAWLQKLPRFFEHFYLLFVVVIGWALFYFTDSSRLFSFLDILFLQTNQPFWNYQLGLLLKENLFWLLGTFVLCMPIYRTLHYRYMSQLEKNKPWLFGAAMLFQFILLFICITLLVGKTYNPFIYYRF